MGAGENQTRISGNHIGRIVPKGGGIIEGPEGILAVDANQYD